MNLLREWPGNSGCFLGLMSGTSADGIDAVAVQLTKSHPPRLLAHTHTPFEPALRDRILQVCLAGTVADICQLNFLLGERFGLAALKVLKKCGLRASAVRGIGSHGQTVHHLPRGKPASTLQIGESSIIAERTGITTVSDFRTRDMAAGGQGAPLVPLADWLLFSHPEKPRIIQNIGGISNLTWLKPSGDLEDIVAFDSGPGNMAIDLVVSAFSSGKERFDRNGRHAAEGKVSIPLLNSLIAHNYFSRTPPKTTGREEFGQEFVTAILERSKRLKLSSADTLATVTALTARTIPDAYRTFLFKNKPLPRHLQVVLGGGGAKNSTLVSMLKKELPAEVLTHDDFGIPNSAKEAMAFALLAARTLDGQTGNVLSATGARRAVVLGKIVPA